MTKKCQKNIYTANIWFICQENILHDGDRVYWSKKMSNGKKCGTFSDQEKITSLRDQLGKNNYFQADR